MPNGEIMVAMQTSLLPCPQLPLYAQRCDVLPALQKPLLSLVQFCDAGFKATLDSERVLMINIVNVMPKHYLSGRVL